MTTHTAGLNQPNPPSPPVPAVPRRLPIGTLTAAGFGCVSVTASALALVLVVPKFISVFADFATPLPWLSIVVVSIPPFVAIVGAVVFCAVLLGLAWVSQYHWSLRVLSLLATLLGVCTVAVIFVGLSLPLPAILESVTHGAP